MNHQLFSQIIHLINSNPDITVEQIQYKLDIDGSAVLVLYAQLQQLGLSIVTNDKKALWLTKNIQPLVIEHIKNEISENIVTQLDFLPIFLTLDSTNQHLKNTKFELSKLIRICLSEHQTSGRGRRAKHWISPIASNIYLSLHARFKMPLKQIGGLSLVVGISIIDGLGRLGIKGLTIKWPNDVYWEDKKLAGILIESTKLQENCVELIIGIGINVDMPESNAIEIDQAWVDLNDITGNQMCRNRVIASVIEQLVSNINKYQQCWFEAFISQWQELDYLFQKTVVVKSPDGKEKIGKAVGVNEQGELLMDLGNKIECVHAGDISVRKV